MANWPRVLLTTVTFEQQGSRTNLRLTWTPHQASAAEVECFAAALAGSAPHVVAGTLERATELAARDAAAANAGEPVVLLSPACASFDQFRNFEVRGDVFRELVLALPGVVGKG